MTPFSLRRWYVRDITVQLRIDVDILQVIALAQTIWICIGTSFAFTINLRVPASDNTQRCSGLWARATYMDVEQTPIHQLRKSTPRGNECAMYVTQVSN